MYFFSYVLCLTLSKADTYDNHIPLKGKYAAKFSSWGILFIHSCRNGETLPPVCSVTWGVSHLFSLDQSGQAAGGKGCFAILVSGEGGTLSESQSLALTPLSVPILFPHTHWLRKLFSHTEPVTVF